MRHLIRQSSMVILASISMAAVAHADCGTATNVLGKVKIKRVADGKESDLKKSDQVCQGDTVTAGDDARAVLTMPGDAAGKENVLNVSPKTSLVIEAYEHSGEKKKVMLNVLYGKMRATVKTKYNPDNKDVSQTFQVKTKSAVAGVRGTDFLTSFNKGEMRVVTFEGRVEVGQLGPGGVILNSKFVGANEMTSAVRGKIAEPKAVPASQLQELNSTSGLGADVSSSSGGPDGRKPASGGSSMPLDSDTMAGEDKRAPASTGGGSGSPVPMPPKVEHRLPEIKKCDFCDRAIQSGGKANVNVRICTTADCK